MILKSMEGFGMDRWGESHAPVVLTIKEHPWLDQVSGRDAKHRKRAFV